MAFRRLPISTLLLLTAAGLFAMRLTVPLFDRSIIPNQYFPGALFRLEFVNHPEVSGYFDLWRGEWWRIVVSGLHHGGILHLLFNAMLIWSCGAILEPRFGRLLYSFYLFSALLISALPELVIESNFVGLSGVGYALFGSLLVLRRVDAQVARAVTPQFVWIGFGWLFACIPLTLLKIAPIANGAHLGGLLYGAFVGWQLFIVGRRRPTLAVLTLGCAHGLAVVALSLILTPLHNGAYFSWRAKESQGLEAQLLWNRATVVDPRQVLAWKAQIVHALTQGDRLSAWSLCLNAAKANRSQEDFIETARELWIELERQSLTTQARGIFDRTFGPEAEAWQRRIFRDSQRILPIGSASGHHVAIDDQPTEPTLEVRINVDEELPRIDRALQLDLIKRFDEQQSALLGESS